MNKNILFAFLILFSFLSLQAQNALDFDGVNDHIDCGNDTSIQISGKYITLEAWVYPTNWTANAFEGNVICKEYNTNNYGYMLRVGDGGKLNFAFGNGSWHEITTAQILSLNTWQHICGTYDGNMMRVYLNGNPVDSLSYSGTITATPLVNLYIGAHVSYSRFYQGKIDEVRVWNKCKTKTEIQNEMNREFCSSMPGLKLYYKLNQGRVGFFNGNVKTAIDLSGMGNYGALTNFQLNGTASNWVLGKTMVKPVVAYHKDTIKACNMLTSPSKKYTWTKSGTYYDTLSSYTTCDSALEIELSISKSSFAYFTLYTCDSIISPSGKSIWKTSGVYNDKIKNLAGCDSVMTITVVKTGSRDTITAKNCLSYTNPYGKTYYQSGVYSDTLANFRGCDSILTTKLTIWNRTYQNLTVYECRSYTSPSGKYTWNQSGAYMDTIVNYTGCDSVLNIQVNILRTSGSTSISNCGPKLSPGMNQLMTQSGTYYDTLMNSRGCDSLLTIEFTLLESSSSAKSVSSCYSYTSDQGKIYTNSGVYTENLNNYLGCDSTITLTVHIIKLNSSVRDSVNNLIAVSPVGQYRWLDCDDNYTALPGQTSAILKPGRSGDFALELTDSGCIDTSECHSLTWVGIDKVLSDGNIQVVPQPAGSYFRVIDENNGNDLHIRVMDYSGKVLLERTVQSGEDVRHELSAGVYILEVNNTQGLYRSILLIGS